MSLPVVHPQAMSGLPLVRGATVHPPTYLSIPVAAERAWPWGPLFSFCGQAPGSRGLSRQLGSRFFLKGE